jgi:hypothetical protein
MNAQSTLSVHGTPASEPSERTPSAESPTTNAETTLSTPKYQPHARVRGDGYSSIRLARSRTATDLSVLS